MKGLFWGIFLIIIVGIGGLVYRNAVEHPSQPITCPLDAFVCPDGTSVARTGSSCVFLECPSPNVSLSDIGISFAIPTGFIVEALPDMTSVAAYQLPAPATASTSLASVVIHRYMIEASSTALATIEQTAIGGASGAPVSATSFSSTILGGRRFTVVSIERFEGVIDTAYYLARSTDVLRFDAINRGADWTNPSLDVATLPANVALIKLLTTLQAQ
jgi:hypothetical protein